MRVPPSEGRSSCRRRFRAWTRIWKTRGSGPTCIAGSSIPSASYSPRGFVPKYYARIEERVYIADPIEIDRKLGLRVPDISVRVRSGHEGTAVEPSGDLAVEVMTEPVVVTTCLEDEVREAFLVVIEAATRQVVTILEVLSPTNKLPNSPGLESFTRKRSEVMKTPTHWVEIDLLRQGASLSARDLIGRPFEYLVHVSPSPMRPKGKLWPIRLDQRLPVISIPLKPEDPDAPLDLQTVLTTAYDRGAYDLQVDYRLAPVPPLDPPWADWAERLLRTPRR